MPTFTIETAHDVPVYRLRSYEADTVDKACRLAVDDGDWSIRKISHDTPGETFVSGICEGTGAPHSARSLPVPSQYGDTMRRKARHFEVLLGLLKLFAAADPAAPELALWRQRAVSAIAKAEAMMAAARDPKGSDRHA